MKQPISEIKRMQRIAGLITESEYRESLIKENITLDPSKLKALVNALMKHGGSKGDREDYKEIAKLLISNNLANAAETINLLDTSPNEMVYDMIQDTYPELWDILFDSDEDGYIALATPKKGLPEKKEEE